MHIWMTPAFLGSLLAFSTTSADCQTQLSPTPKRNIQVKVVGAKTYSETHLGGTAANSGNRARITRVYLQVPKSLYFSASNPDENVDEGVFTLQDSQGRDYIFGDNQSGSFGVQHKNNVLEIYWICAYRPVPVEERKSLHIKTRLYFYNRAPRGKAVGSRWLDIPVRYYP